MGEDETEAVALQVRGSVEASRCAQELSSGLRSCCHNKISFLVKFL